MRIGFTTVFAWRPHVEHMHFLAQLARKGGHETRFLSCDADLSSCYTRELRPHENRLLQCTACRIGGLRSFESSGGQSLGQLSAPDAKLPEDSSEWSRSSASTLKRFETDEEYESSQFQEIANRLRKPTEQAYAAALRWIETERLDGIVLFNGRMDATRGVLEAAERWAAPSSAWNVPGLVTVFSFCPMKTA